MASVAPVVLIACAVDFLRAVVMDDVPLGDFMASSLFEICRPCCRLSTCLRVDNGIGWSLQRAAKNQWRRRHHNLMLQRQIGSSAPVAFCRLSKDSRRSAMRRNGKRLRAGMACVLRCDR